jgi:hypothetical protein
MVTNEEATKAKERALTQGIKVWELEPGVRYAVPSCSREGVAYEIKVENTGDLTCPCPSGQYRGCCVHVGAVLIRLQVEKELAQPQISEQLERDISDLYR